MTSMPRLPVMDWDYADRLRHTQKGAGTGAQDTYFTYDAAGQRVRKVAVASGTVKERIYLGGYEVYRERAAAPGAPVDFERQTLHVMDDQRRVAMAETKTIDGGAVVPTLTTRWRFQLDNHLGSATLELDDAGSVISYEEYHPYGSTAFHTANGAAQVSAKRYRYTGKEKDEETGLYYHGARYYAPWLGRWTAADPSGSSGGPNLYEYVAGSPINLSDPDGRKPRSWGERAALWLDDQIRKSPVAEGVVENLEKRGDALVRAPGAIRELYEKEGAAGVLRTVGKGTVHLVEDTANAAIDVGYYGAKAVAEGDADAAKKAASRGVDVVLGVADTVTLFEGAAALKNAGVGGAKALASAAKNLGEGGALVTAEGFVISGKALASTAPLAAAGADAAKGTVMMMSQGGNLSGGNAPKPKAAPKAASASAIPSVQGGAFAKWFNKISVSDFEKLWSNPAARRTIQSRLRAPGGMHEWLLVARANVFKRWGITAEQVSELRTAIDKVEFVNPAGKHGAKGSTIAHNELLRLVDSAGSYQDFVQNLQSWASTRLKGGTSALPPGLRPTK